LLAFSAHSERTPTRPLLPAGAQTQAAPCRNHPNLWWPRSEENGGGYGLIRVQRGIPVDGDLVKSLNGLDDGSAVVSLSAFGNASVGRTRTARNPSPAPSGEA